MDNHIFFMQQAFIQAQKAYDLMEVPVGAVIVKDNNIIGTGYNKKEMLKDPVSHAEIEAIKEACINTGDWRLNDAIMYVTAEPCIMCAGAISNARIKRVYFGAEETNSKDNLCEQIFSSTRLNHKVELIKLEEYSSICSEILSSFFKNHRQKK